MIYLQHNDSNICIPQHLSKYGLYSSQLFLINTICSYMYNYKSLTILGALLYTTSLLHWRKLRQTGFIKNIDMLTCIIVINYITFYDSLYFCPQHFKLWIAAKIIAITSYAINQYIESYQSYPEGSTYFASDEPYQYFSLKYTWPNTIQRELHYKYNVAVHLLFLHVYLALTVIFCVMNSPYCANYYQ